MTRKFEYRADFKESGLPEMLYSIHRFRVPGTIEARQGNVIKRVLLQDGHVIHAASTLLDDSLGEFLKRVGKLSDENYDQIARARAHTRKRFGELILERRLLTPAEVYKAIQHHIEEIVWSLFYWREGEITFTVGEIQGIQRVQIQLPVRRVILEGIKRAPEAKPLVERLGKRQTVLEPTFDWEDLIELGLDEDEFRLLTAVDGRKNLYELCSIEPLSAAENAKLLYAFQVLHLVGPSSAQATGTDSRDEPLKVRLKTSGDLLSG